MAVKQLKQHDARNDIRFLREIAILKECRSGHIVQFLVSLHDIFSIFPLGWLPSNITRWSLKFLCMEEELTTLCMSPRHAHVVLARSMKRRRVELPGSP